MPLTHLQRLEAESIHIMREVVAETDNPVMLYSIGKDSAVMLHLALRAFYPAKPPFPLLHVDTTWKFRDMYAFRDRLAREVGMKLIVHTNAEGVEKNVNPFTHGSAVYTDVMKTQALQIPHPRYGERRFTLEPLAELNPALRDPLTGKSVATMLESVRDQTVRRYMRNDPSSQR